MFREIASHIILLLFLFLSVTAISQNSASANFTASVTIIEPIQVQTISNMNFAHIDAREGGSVILHPDNSRSSIGDLRLKNSQLASAATFEVKGQKGYTYDINIPQGNFHMTNGTEMIVLKDFRLQTEMKEFGDQSQILRLGATIDIPSDQKPGKYITQSPLAITVTYN